MFCSGDTHMEEKKVVKVTRDDGSAAVYKEVSIKAIDKTSTSHVMTDDEGLDIKAEKAAVAVSDFIDASIEKASEVVKSKIESLEKSGALEPGYFAAKRDSTDIARLGGAR